MYQFENFSHLFFTLACYAGTNNTGSAEMKVYLKKKKETKPKVAGFSSRKCCGVKKYHPTTLKYIS